MRDIIRWDPFRDLFALRAEMDRLLARVPGPGESSLPRRWAPASDVVETDDAIVITAELPGVKDEDVAITVENGVLRISGERRLEHETEDDRYHRLERSYGGFERTFPLPPSVDEDDINAGIAYGVLKISIPKPTATEPKRIAINPAGD
ncbi:MAG: Hsp20/alpha crystallin family protein [Thermoleophilia bacterium]